MTVLHKKRRVAPPINSQRNNPYCDLLGFYPDAKLLNKNETTK